MLSRAVSLRKRPLGMPSTAEFQVTELDAPDPSEVEVLVENLCMSVDSYMRRRMIDRKSYVPPFQIGEVLTGGAIGRVASSNDSSIAEGEHVYSFNGSREALVAPGSQLCKLDDLQAPASAYLGVLGMPGMTAIHAAPHRLASVYRWICFETAVASVARSSNSERKATGSELRAMPSRDTQPRLML